MSQRGMVTGDEMAALHDHQLDDEGICSSCKEVANDLHRLHCYICTKSFHGDCDGVAPFTTKSFVSAFKKLRNNDSFVFICPHCKTQRENIEAGTHQQQISLVITAVKQIKEEMKQEMKQIKEEVKQLKNESNTNEGISVPKTTDLTETAVPVPPPSNLPTTSAWSDPNRTKEIVRKEKVTLCIKRNNEKIDLSKLKEVVAKNGVQVSKTSVNKENGDVYCEFPSNEQRDKLSQHLVSEGRNCVNVKSKCPIINIRNVCDYVNEDDFVERMKQQNQRIAQLIDNGSEFSIVFTKEQNSDPTKDAVHQIVARVSEELRDVIKEAGDKTYIGFSSLRVFDRFYVKSCAKCHKHGHFHAECDQTQCCGYCMAENHTSRDCPIYKEKKQAEYKCVNCKEAGKPEVGHSSHWHQCPTYLDQQKKMMKRIPYYSKN